MKKAIVLILAIIIFSSCQSSNYDMSSLDYSLNKDGIYAVLPNQKDEKQISPYYDSELIFAKDNILVIERWRNFKGEGIHKIDVDGNKKTIVRSKCADAFLLGDWLYYCDNTGIYKITTDGEQKTQIKEAECASMVASGDCIYYTSHVNLDDTEYHDDGPPSPSGELCRINLDGSNLYKFNLLVYNLTEYNGCIYFSDSSDDVFYKMDPKTLKKDIMYKEYFIEDPYFYDNDLYFVSNRSLKRMSLKTGKITELTQSGWPSIVNILNGYLYFESDLPDFLEGAGLYKIKTSGNMEIIKVD